MGLVVISSWGGGVVLVASLVSAASSIAALAGARRNAKAIREMAILKDRPPKS